ncbi:MAG: CBS domain-containing protein [Actinobacteria bacterium]|nr:MAG: CBS domain-containing protein [Actinomycetota bacterium]TMK47166.1 MAG: CBS domain-containing protein [Actinomycetota bacterium]
MQVGDVMKSAVKTTTPDQTFADVAKLLKDNEISSVVVMDGDRLAGIVTERDLVNLVAEGLDPQAAKVADRMSTNLDTVEPRTDIAEAAEHMARLRIRHLPVLDKGTLVGIISIRDLTNWAVGEITGGHELPDLERSHTTLSAAAEINRNR